MSNFFSTLVSIVIAIFFKDRFKKALMSVSRTPSQEENNEHKAFLHYNDDLDPNSFNFGPSADEDENILDECVFIGTEDLENYVGPSVYFLNPRNWGGNDSLWVYPDGRRVFRRSFH